MKFVIVGAHLLREDIEPLAEALPAGALYLSAVEVADDQPLGDRDLLLRVAAVRGKLLDVATFVAIRYGFAAASADEAARKCGGQLAQWRELLSANRENVEMTMKVAVASPRMRPDRRHFSSGADYLRALHDVTHTSNVAPGLKAAAEQLLLPLSVEHRWIHRDEKSVELALLVPRTQLEDVRQSGERLRDACPDVPFLLSGPWPLEVFAE